MTEYSPPHEQPPQNPKESAEKMPSPPKLSVHYSEKQQHQWAMWTHLSALASWLGIPFGNVLGPLVLWLIRKDEMPFANEHGKEALNFHLTSLIVFFIGGIASVFMTIVTLGLAIPIFIVGYFAYLTAITVFTIIAAVKAKDGLPYRYPLTIPFIH